MLRLLTLMLAACLGLWSAAALTGCDDKKDAGTPAPKKDEVKKDADEEVEEKPIEPSKIPAAAMASIKKEIGDATPIKRALVGQKRGKPYYEAKYDAAAGKRMMIQVAEDGKVYKKVEDDDPEPTK